MQIVYLREEGRVGSVGVLLEESSACGLCFGAAEPAHFCTRTVVYWSDLMGPRWKDS
jgi:hypothetical protein